MIKKHHPKSQALIDSINIDINNAFPLNFVDAKDSFLKIQEYISILEEKCKMSSEVSKLDENLNKLTLFLAKEQHRKLCDLINIQA